MTDTAALRERLRGTTGRTFRRSLDELVETPGFLEVLPHGGRLVRNRPEQGGREAHPVAVQARGAGEPLAGDGPDLVEQGEGDGHEPCAPRGVGVADSIVRLDRGRPCSTKSISAAACVRWKLHTGKPENTAEPPCDPW